MSNSFLRTVKYLLIVALCISSCAITGCLESTFTLASDSRLPKCITLPPGLTRTDVSVILNLYAPLWGPDAKFILRDRKGKKLAEVKGKVKTLPSSRYFGIVAENGMTELVRLRPYVEHENMEQFGIPVALFYVIDDPDIRKEILAGGPDAQKQ